jgi:hypothetical protein
MIVVEARTSKRHGRPKINSAALTLGWARPGWLYAVAVLSHVQFMVLARFGEIFLPVLILVRALARVIFRISLAVIGVLFHSGIVGHYACSFRSIAKILSVKFSSRRRSMSRPSSLTFSAI